MTAVGWPREDRGVSVIELVVVMVISGIVLAGLSAVFLSGLDANRFATTRGNATADARIAMEAMSRALRVAVPVAVSTSGSAFDVAAGGQVVFYASLSHGAAPVDPLPTKVEFSVDSARRCLLEAKTPATAGPSGPTYDAAERRERCIAFGDVNPSFPSNRRLFTYYFDAAGTTPVPTNSAGAVPSGALGSIVSVQIDLGIRPEPQPGSAMAQVRSLVALANSTSVRES